MSGHLAVKLLSSYLDAEVSPAELRLVKGHLEKCSECRRTIASLRAVANGVRRLQSVAPPATLASSVERRVLRASQSEPLALQLELGLKRWMRQPVLAPVFAVVLALGAILYLFAFGVARDGSRATRIVVASAPSEAHSEPFESSVELDRAPEMAEQEAPNSNFEPKASSRPELPAAASEIGAVGKPRAPKLRQDAAGQRVEASPARAPVARDAVEPLDGAKTESLATSLGAVSEFRDLAGRRFVVQGETWVESGLEDEVAAEILELPSDAAGLDPGLEAYRELGRVRIRHGERVVEVIYSATQPRP